MHKSAIYYRRVHRMEYCLRWVWEASSASLMLIHSYHRPHVLVAPIHVYMWCQSRTPGSLTLVSVTTKHISLPWACNRHLSMVELPNATGQTGETAPGDLLHLRQGILLDHSGMEGASSRIIFESSGLRKQVSRPFFGFWFLHSGFYYLIGSLALRSFICVDVGEPTSRPCSMTGMRQDHHLPILQDFELLGTTMWDLL